MLFDINILMPRQNSRHFADDIFKCIVWNEYVRISIMISLEFVHKSRSRNYNNASLVQIIPRHRRGDKPLSEPMMISLLSLGLFFKCIFWNEYVRISIMISLEFVHKSRSRSNNNASLIQIIPGRRRGDKPLSEPIMISLLSLGLIDFDSMKITDMDISYKNGLINMT